jgi:hypothetical protein
MPSKVPVSTCLVEATMASALARPANAALALAVYS